MVIERYGMKALKIDKNIERRIEKRHTCSEEIFFATQSRLYEGQLKDYGRNGLFIKTKEVYGEIRKDSELSCIGIVMKWITM
jgi:hypothetical protein